MTSKSKVLAGIILSTLVSSGVYAASDVNEENTSVQKEQTSKHSKDKRFHKKDRMPMMSMMKKLNLSDEQKEKMRSLMKEQRKLHKQKSNDSHMTIGDAFTKSTFDKEKFINIMNQKRDNMLKSKAEMMEKMYLILDTKQKEQFKESLDSKIKNKHNKDK